MHDIKINRLELENFKAHKHLVLDLNGRSVSIYGDNATGKTSIFDGLTWLLFGKDSLGNGEKNIDIKPLDSNGEVADHQAITSAEAEFLADGELRSYKRTYREIWATKRGSGAPAYEGNTSDYFVDGVPVKKNAYDSSIREMVSEDLFRMLTSVSHFAAGMKWQERRSVLFDMSGTLTDREIMAQDDRFAPLAESLGKLTLAEYKAKLLHQRKGLTGIRDDAPTRINECVRVLQGMEGIDFSVLRQEEQALSQKREELHRQILALDQDTILENKRLELRETKFRRDQLESQNRAYLEKQRAAAPDLSGLRRTICAEQDRMERNRRDLEREQRRAKDLEADIQASRMEWVQVNGESFAGGICPACGQALPFEQLQAATKDFNEKKEARLAAVIAKADRQKEEQSKAAACAESIAAEIQQSRQTIDALKAELEAAEPEQTAAADMDGYREGMDAIRQQVEELQEEISRLMANGAQVRQGLRVRLTAVEDQIREAQAMIAKEGIRVQTEKRISELKADARNAAEALEGIEQMLYLMDTFTRYKATFVEKSVNDHFRIASFRLFREQANGGLEERCDAVYDGIPFQGLNNGMKVNVGIDIINALSRHYGVRVPLFIDNAESVTRLEACQAQVIRLVVSENDKELRIV